MTPRGSNALLDMRKSGNRPVGPVWVTFGNFHEPDWWRWAETQNKPEILIHPDDPIDRLDLRCIVGLEIIFFMAEWSDKTGRLFERLTEYASEISVMSPAFEDDIGWFWVKGIGQIPYLERHLLTQFKNAQQNAMAAAVKGDDKAYRAAQASEADALKRAKWLR